MEYKIIDESLRIAAFTTESLLNERPKALQDHSEEHIRELSMFYDMENDYLYINEDGMFYDLLIELCSEILIHDTESIIGLCNIDLESKSTKETDVMDIILSVAKNRRNIEESEKTMHILSKQPCRVLNHRYINPVLYKLMVEHDSVIVIYDRFFNLGYICGVQSERNKECRA